MKYYLRGEIAQKADINVETLRYYEKNKLIPIPKRSSKGYRLYSEDILTPKNASYKSQCVGCGICEKVCPLNNIKMINKGPHWEKDCSTCLACFHWCPKKAVKGGKMLNKRDRYHHPEMTIEDMDLKNKIPKCVLQVNK